MELFSSTKVFLKVNGYRATPMGRELYTLRMEIRFKEITSRIVNVALEPTPGQMELWSLVIISKVKSMVSISGVVVTNDGKCFTTRVLWWQQNAGKKWKQPGRIQRNLLRSQNPVIKRGRRNLWHRNWPWTRHVLLQNQRHHQALRASSEPRYPPRPPRPAVVDPIALLELKALQMKRSL